MNEAMKNLISFLGTIAIIVLQSLVISAVFTLGKFLLSLLNVCDTPTWIDIVGGASGLFVLFFLYSVGKTAITLYRYHKDPVFKELNMTTGMSWEDYQKLKNKG